MFTIDTNSAWFNNLVAQLGHFGWGALIFLSFAHHGHAWWGFLAVMAWALSKEFIFDALVEQQPFKDNLFDFWIYSAGLLTGVLIAFL